MANHQLHQVVLINQSNIACARQTLQILRHRMRKSAAGHQNTLQTAVQKHRTSKLLNLVGGDLHSSAIMLHLNINRRKIQTVRIAGNNIHALIVGAAGYLGRKTESRKNIGNNLLKIFWRHRVNMLNQILRKMLRKLSLSVNHRRIAGTQNYIQRRLTGRPRIRRSSRIQGGDRVAGIGCIISSGVQLSMISA